MKKPYSETYRVVCLAIQRMVEQRIGRSLTTEEQGGIWNAGSLMMLEVVEHDLIDTRDNAAIPEILTAKAVDFYQRFTIARAKTEHLLAQHPVRAFFAGHHHQLKVARTMYDLMKIADQYPVPRTHGL